MRRETWWCWHHWQETSGVYDYRNAMKAGEMEILVKDVCQLCQAVRWRWV